MKALLLLLICVGLTLSARKSYERYALDNAEEYFEEFIKTYNKVYANEAERQGRFEIFKNNLQIINQQNEESESAIFGITKFSDLATEEVLSFLSGLNNGFDKPGCTSPPRHFKGTPEALDWRDKGVVTSVKDQLGCWSGWAFSATANLESQYAMKYNEKLDLSEQQLVDCDIWSFGCSGLPSKNPYLYWIKRSGAELEQDYPYAAVDEGCRFNVSKVKAKVTGCISYKPKNEEQLKDYLNDIGPLTIGIDSFQLFQYREKIVTQCLFYGQNHGVLLVGYGTEDGVPYWLIKNSWGEDWGESGYVRLKRGINACGIANSTILSAIIT